ncbi:bacterioferritin [Candidatus Acetothermia bacterium]|jgi:bacterioferritin|nr:bacterioferritin [Candidatus Acetothermia bacterium]MCI2431755.1 bacterioferritin [Candidatus Acetothermia bacterium]MCI2436761.1 bacterioferritin [Candidatus Acetothermia bacterium]
MKGHKKIIDTLNELLRDELTAINQYMVHAKMCENWGYEKLYKVIEKKAVDEMHHAEWLIERILFLEGTPNVSKLDPMKIGQSVPEIIENDWEAELLAVPAYNQAIALAHELADQATVDLLIKILKMEEGHVDWAEIQQAQIEQMGLENYLSAQIEEAQS